MLISQKVKKQLGSRSKNIVSRFMSKFIQNGKDKCWIWTSSKNENGYGIFKISKRPLVSVKAHRFSYEHFKDSFDKKLHILHSCDNPGCVNPNHLFLGTHQENMKDMLAKGRVPKGSKSAVSKLTEAQVLEIRNKYVPRKYTAARLALEYKIHSVTIWHIVNRRTWKHI